MDEQVIADIKIIKNDLHHFKEKIEDLHDSLTEFMKQGHPSCEFRETRIKKLEENFEKLKEDTEHLKLVNGDQTSDIKTLKGTIRFLRTTLVGIVGGVGLLAVETVIKFMG